MINAVDVDVDVDVEKRESLGSTGAVTMENNTEFPQKIKNRATLWPTNLTSGY